jgi:biotin-dependent carboxylase-like uncharacterized protein
MIVVERAPGFVTVQDRGWRASRAVGLPPCGALDQEALALANALVGNSDDAAALEITAGVLAVRFEQPAVVALTGAHPVGRIGNRPAPPGTTLSVAASEELVVDAIEGGRFVYLSVRGGIDVPPVLDRRCTYLPTGLGGFRGRRLMAADRLAIGPEPELECPPPGYRAPDESARTGPIALVPGPQASLFADAVRERLTTGWYAVTPRSDRMGTRLAGPPLAPDQPARLPSESTCVGAVQVPDDGQPIVVLCDGPTIGGYPKIGVIATIDLPRFVQTPVGSGVRFEWVGVGEAQRGLYEAAARRARRLGTIRSAAR